MRAKMVTGGKTTIEGWPDRALLFQKTKPGRKGRNVNLCRKGGKGNDRMRLWLLKFMGFILWGIFLLTPFVVRADEGFSAGASREIASLYRTQRQAPFLTIGSVSLRMDKGSSVSVPVEDKWSVRLHAGRDSVLTHSQPRLIRHDRIPLDDGEHRGLLFSIGVKYTF